MSDSDSSERTIELLARVATLERLLAEQTERLERLEHRAATTPPSSNNPPAPPLFQPVTAAQKPEVGRMLFGSSFKGAPDGARATSDFESRVGGRWLNRIGVVVLVFGVAFFIKYAFDGEWVTPLMRVMLGVVGGAAGIAGGELMRRRGYSDYAHGLTGGGIVILYLAVYAAFGFYQLINQPSAFLLMVAVTTFGVLLAVRADAQAVAVLGLVGGFLTPVLLAQNESREVALFGYMTLLDLGVLALAIRKGWRVLTHLAFVATALLTAGWAFEHYDAAKFTTAFVFVTIFFLVFASIPLLQNLLRARPSRLSDISLALTNAALYFAAAYGLLDSRGWGGGALASSLALFYFALFILVFGRDDARLRTTFAGLSVLFVTIGVALLFGERWVTTGWAIEGALLARLATRPDARRARYAAAIVFILASLRWLALDVMANAPAAEGFFPLLNTRAFTAYVLAAALAFAAYCHKDDEGDGAAGDSSDGRNVWATVYALAANAVVLVLVTADVNLYFDSRGDATGDVVARVENAKQGVISVVWALWAVAGLLVGVRWRLRNARLAALALLGVTIVKVFLFDLASLDAVSRIFSFLVLGALLLGVSFVYQKRQRTDESK